jgi:hypothetical protein
MLRVRSVKKSRTNPSAQNKVERVAEIPGKQGGARRDRLAARNAGAMRAVAGCDGLRMARAVISVARGASEPTVGSPPPSAGLKTRRWRNWRSSRGIVAGPDQ